MPEHRATARELQILRRLHILFVNSDPDGYERFQQALDDGFVIDSATSLGATRLFLETTLPDVVISEVQLEQESGLDLCRMLRNNTVWRRLPVMLITSFATLQDKIAGFDAGADDYVVKPFDARHLMARIRLLARIKRIEISMETK